MRFIFVLILSISCGAQRITGNGRITGKISYSVGGTVSPVWQQAMVLPAICAAQPCTFNALSDTLGMVFTHSGSVPTAVNNVYTSPLANGLPTVWTEASPGSPIPGTAAPAGWGALAPDGTTLLVMGLATPTATVWYSTGLGTGAWTSAASVSTTQFAVFPTFDGSNCWFTPGDSFIYKSTDNHCTAFTNITGTLIPSGANQAIFGATGTGAGGAPNTGNHFKLLSRDWGDGNGLTLTTCGEGGFTQIVPTFVTGTATFTSGSTSVTLSTANAGLITGNLFSSNASTKGGTVITTYPGSGTSLSIFPPAIASGSANYYSFKLVQAWLGEMTATATNGSTTFTLAAYYPWLDGLTGVSITNGATGVGIPGGTTGSISGLTVTLSTPATGSPVANTTYVVGAVGSVNSWGGYHANCTGFEVGSSAVVAFRGNNASTTHLNSIPTTGTRTVMSVASPVASPNTNFLGPIHYLHGQNFYYAPRNTSNVSFRYISNDNGATWTNMDTLPGLGSSCNVSADYQSSTTSIVTNSNYVYSMCQSGSELWVYGPL